MKKGPVLNFCFIAVSLLLFSQCSSEAPGYVCEPTGEIKCVEAPDNSTPSESLKKLRTDVLGTWKFYSRRSIDPAWKTDSTYTAQNLKKIPVICLGSDGIMVDKNGRKAKECTYCYSIKQSPTSQDSFLIEVGDYVPKQYEPVFVSGQHIACTGDTLYLNSTMDRFIFRDKFIKIK